MSPTAAALLSGGLRPGVHWVPVVPSPDAVEADLAAAGWAVRRLPAADVRDRAAFLAACGRALDFPDWYGQNWDALADCLADLSWLPGAGIVVLTPALPGSVAEQVFAAAAAQRAALGLPPLHLFVVPDA